MDRQPISEARIWEKIQSGVALMNPLQDRMWEGVKILPTKWGMPWGGAARDGVWAVAVLGQTAVWYDDIEEGFVLSPYGHYGTVAQSKSRERALDEAIQDLINRL
jgi:hypothetical protein